MDDSPRFITSFSNQVIRVIDSEFFGPSRIFFWPNWKEAHLWEASFGPTRLYSIFRDLVEEDLYFSSRASDCGTLPLLRQALPYCFRGAPSAVPPGTREICLRLVGPRTSLQCRTERLGNGETVSQAVVHHWPSWLTIGGFKIIDMFTKFFYLQPPIPMGPCRLCGEMTPSFWVHIFEPCPNLHRLANTEAWQDFCSLLELGFRGLAVFALFPLFMDHIQLVYPRWGE